MPKKKNKPSPLADLAMSLLPDNIEKALGGLEDLLKGNLADVLLENPTALNGLLDQVESRFGKPALQALHALVCGSTVQAGRASEAENTQAQAEVNERFNLPPVAAQAVNALADKILTARQEKALCTALAERLDLPVPKAKPAKKPTPKKPSTTKPKKTTGKDKDKPAAKPSKKTTAKKPSTAKPKKTTGEDKDKPAAKPSKKTTAKKPSAAKPKKTAGKDKPAAKPSKKTTTKKPPTVKPKKPATKGDSDL